MNERVRYNLKRFIYSKNKKSYSLIWSEVTQLRKYWGYIPSQYYTHDFYSNDCDLTLNEMKKYIPSYYFYKILFPQYDNVKLVSKLVENKIEMNYLFRSVGLQNSTVLFVKSGLELRSIKCDLLTDEYVKNTLDTTVCSRLFIKPVMGRGGNGIIIAKRIGSEFYYDGRRIDYNYFINLKGDYVVESEIIQHNYLNEIYSKSVNTLRAITLRHDNGNVEFIAAILRIGVAGKEIDNCCAGGLLIGIDVDTGGCVKSFATYSFGNQRVERHPDSGFDFSSLQLPNWEYIKNEILLSADKLTQLNLAGWDIAITENGISIIEVNTVFGIDGLQSGVGGIRDLFIDGEPKPFSKVYNFKGKKYEPQNFSY
ncbi:MULTISPECIES: sugar-transfer associated ATP-grasp domain-containing protein [unclassified Vibrio]|uniref:sugar-transfer associated ATP-grasp domain-containing protein n=1 Tax=unclassified Vibrio TaxID=2614977 RepID=UPI00159638F9|nr:MULTISPECIES: sugar-transfer associated ATP-grasp domain-containing protein [unclassified Vibrio]